MTTITYPIPTPRKDAVGQQIDQHRTTCTTCTHGTGCRTGRKLWRQLLTACDQDYDAAHAHRGNQ